MRVKQRLDSVKKHVVKHRGKYIAVTITSLWFYTNIRQSRCFEQFLETKDIDPLEYLCPEWYEEKISQNKQ